MLCRWSVPRAVQGKVHHCCTTGDLATGYCGGVGLGNELCYKMNGFPEWWLVTVSVWSNIKHQKLQNCFHFKHTQILKRVVGKLFKSMITGPDLTLRYSRCNKSNFINIYGTKSVVSAAAQCQKSEYKWWWTWKVYVAAKCQGLAFQSLNTGNIVTLKLS